MRMRVGTVLVLATASVVGLGAYLRLSNRSEPTGTRLPTGKYINPAGESIDVGSYPANMIVSPDGKHVVVTNTGFRQQLSVIDASTGSLTDKVEFNGGPNGEPQALYYGLAFNGDGELFASNGPLDQVSTFRLSAEGKLTAGSVIGDPSGRNNEPNFIAGVGFGSQRRILFAAHNEAYRSTKLRSSLSVIDVRTNAVQKTIELPGFPLAVVAIDKGLNKDKVFASCERDGVVAAIDIENSRVTPIRTGMHPTALILNKAQTRLFVSNSGSDTVSVIDTESNRVVKTILTRPAALRGLPGSTPLGLALSPDEWHLYVALGDMNAVGVIDLRRNALVGYVPAGWYPTSVALAGGHLFVANAKGMKGTTPNGNTRKKNDRYIQDIIEGTVSKIELAAVTKQLPEFTQQVLANNFAEKGTPESRSIDFKNPGIKHVIYIIKENRTYDQVLGDDPRGNGDPSLLMFGKTVTPNQHALADRFVLLDNFNVCAEVSGDGWQWSSAGMASEYTSRNVPFTYSGRGRDYDFEGQTNGVTGDYAGVKDVGDVPGGYIWDACLRHHVSFRNYGFFVDPISKEDAKAGGIEIDENVPTKKSLFKATDLNYRQYDLHYADSDLWKHYDSPEPRQLKTYGKLSAPSRFSEWKHEFDDMIAKGEMPRFQMVRFCRNHTAGTTPGLGTPEAMVADNDYAVGQLVDAVSHSPFWKDTAIFILEDDAQAGQDHVDCHRSICFVVSPFVKQRLVDSRFYNTDSVLRTMELLLGMKPMNQYDAVANPLMVFDVTAANMEPYNAIIPAKEIATAVNTAKAYRSSDSEKMISWYKEESLPDIELNDILWHAVKGAVEPVNAAPVAEDEDEDEEKRERAGKDRDGD